MRHGEVTSTIWLRTQTPFAIIRLRAGLRLPFSLVIHYGTAYRAAMGARAVAKTARGKIARRGGRQGRSSAKGAPMVAGEAAGGSTPWLILRTPTGWWLFCPPGTKPGIHRDAPTGWQEMHALMGERDRCRRLHLLVRRYKHVWIAHRKMTDGRAIRTEQMNP